MKKVISVLLVLFSANVLAADSSVLWQSDTFVAPYSNNIIAVSNEITNNNEFYPAIKVNVEYEEILPVDCTCKVRAVVEEEVADGVWKALGYQFEAIAGNLAARDREIVISPDINFDAGLDVFVAVGNGIRISRTQGNVPEKLRVVLYNEDTGTNVLQSVKVTAYAKLYD
jgi:hypothetical protein